MSHQIIVGQLKDIKTLDTPEGKVDLGVWDKRSMWSYLRLNYGRSIDQVIKDALDKVKAGEEARTGFRVRKGFMADVFYDILDKMPKSPREIQFILDDKNNVKAVASLRHLLVPPEQVYDVIEKIMAEKGMGMMKVDELQGLCYKVKEIKGIDGGLQIHGGDIITRRAIRVTSMFRIQDCLNPLSWLGVGGFGKFTPNRKFNAIERVLRIKVISELEPRLKNAIMKGLEGQKKLELQIYQAQGLPMTFKTAKILVSAMGLSYGLGGKTIQQVLDQFKSEEKQTQWGLSMALSWVAAHGGLKKTPKTKFRMVNQKLATIGGVTLLLDDIATIEKKSLEWLKTKVKKGNIKTIDELLKDVI